MTQTLAPAGTVTVTRLAGNIGARIDGVDASRPLSEADIATVRRALLDHKVVFLRDQELDYDSQVRFVQQFGELTLGHPIYDNADDKPFLRAMDSAHGTRANHWHTDLTFIERPPAAAFLHAKVIPPVGGDTIWANTVTAYQSMPADLRALADQLRVLHSNDSDFTDDTVSHRRDYIADIIETEHPAVRVHPETGERAILLGGFARSVVGYSPAVSRNLMQAIQEYVTKPEQTVRWQWRVGDMAIWDNRATQHYAVYDYGTAHRRAERLTLVGPVPVGVDGRPSAAVSGNTDAYSGGM
ncbi:TauD/TfdA dioxygenase family protein [Dactylosporangium sp. CA-139114]|uniref:TauD/TfdA dioxygenase family protein n=1 Tax=Dactylosporangium sp. CA-139114 TaxID=3239931 RepID=UPI003D9815E6